MTVVETNHQILNYWYSLSPKTFDGIDDQGNFLVYNGEKVDISKFSFYEIINSNSFLTDQLSTLSPDDFFKIIKLHCLLLQGDSKENKQEENHNKEMLEMLKQTDPVMKNVTVIDRHRNGVKSQYFSIRDENGIPHIFYNDRNVDIMAIYTELKRTYGDSYKVSDLISCLNRKLYDVELKSSTNIIGHSKTSEDFNNKINGLNKQYKGDLSYQVYGNQEHDIAVINDSNDPNRTKIITYDRTNDGTLVAETHMQVEKNDELNKQKTSEELENKKEKEEIALIPYEQFIALLESNKPFDEKQRKQVDLWYATIGDIIIYEDYLCERAVQVLRNYSTYLTTIEINADQKPLSEHQLEALEKYREMVNKKGSIGKDKESLEYNKENVKKLTLSFEEDSRAANVNVIQIIWTVIGILTILTAVTLYIVS